LFRIVEPDRDFTKRAELSAVENPVCYHCGLAVPADTVFAVSINDQARRMCCAGCQAVAEAIVANGLTEYYTHRDALPESPREALPQALQDLGMFDHPDVQKTFVRAAPGEHELEAALILEGITCGACVWLNEQHLARQPGVTAVDINYATRRARVRWDERRIKLSQILEAIAAIGYCAHPYDVTRSEQLATKERKAALWRLFVAAFGMMQVMMYAIPVYLADEGTMSPEIHRLMQWAALVLTMPVILYSAAPFFRSAWRDLRLRRLGMDVPVAIGVGTAFAASAWATLTAQGEVYFDSVTMFVFFLLAGRYLEMLARQRAVRGVEAMNRALPAVAARFSRWPAQDIERVAVAELQAGDHVLVKPGESVPADGSVVDGQSTVDESLLTGESRPVGKSVGSTLIGGSVNVGSPLVFRVERVGDKTRLAVIQQLMEQAAADKPKLVVTADRYAGAFVTALLVLAVATAIVWQFIDPSRTLPVFVAVLVVSCPCALSLATPAALTVATGAMARHGLLVARGHAIETLALTTHFVFDKTGTLTEGRLSLLEAMPLGGRGRDEIRLLAAAMERTSEHPLARALGHGLESRELPTLEGVRAQTGSGMEAVKDGVRLRLGSLRFAGELHSEPVPDELDGWLNDGNTVIALSSTSGWLGFFRFGDAVRPEAAAALGALRGLRAEVSILSGDGQEAVDALARNLGVARAQGGLAPEDKHAQLKALQAEGAIVAMIGDGVNDAPVLAQAQVSVAMGGGTELARGQADAILLSGNLSMLVAGVSLARKTLRVVRQNLAWAFAYNLAAIPLAMSGLVTPWMAGIGMSASSLLVVLNALRLQRT
jgi:Cu2+-exporting ATPase